MKIGTKSVLFGAHCFFLHPWFVAWGWWKMYGWSSTQENEFGQPATIKLWHPWLWIAFLVHDLGYFGKPNMDGPEGEQHPRLGASILYTLQGWWIFGRQPVFYERYFRYASAIRWWHLRRRLADAHLSVGQQLVVWGNEALFHSRFLAKQYDHRPSRLCVADKYAIVCTPGWLYLPMVRATGEIHEYMALSHHNNATGGKYSGFNLDVSSQRAWMADCKAYVRRWIEEHRDGREDSWTPSTRRAASATGVHQ